MGKRQMSFLLSTKYPSWWELWQDMLFPTQARMLYALHCTQPPVPTRACVLLWLTPFQACREESPVAQGSAAAAAAAEQFVKVRGKEGQLMCAGQRFCLLSFCVTVYLLISQGRFLDPSSSMSTNLLLISHSSPHNL